MHLVVERVSAAPPGTVWEAIADVSSWPERCPAAFAWTHMDGPLTIGATVRVLRPGMRVTNWTVEALDPQRSLRWTNRGPGFVMVADRVLSPHGTGSTIRLSLAVTGPMAWAVSLIARRPMRRYLGREADWLAGLAAPAR